MTPRAAKTGVEARSGMGVPGARGWSGPRRRRLGAGAGADEWRGTTVQVCGLWPFSTGTGTPMVGVPLGPQLDLGRDVVRGPDQLVSGRAT